MNSEVKVVVGGGWKKRFLMNSGGKDSMASTIIAFENGIELDGVVISEVMFDHSRNISGEHPIHADWLHNIAIPTIERKFGYKVILLKSKEDYLSFFNKRTNGSKKNPQRKDKKRGFPLGLGCGIRRDLKIKPIDDWCKSQEEFEKIIGIAYDEKERLERLHNRKNERSLLEEYKITEEQCFEICRKYNLLSPYYELGASRQGCWFCPNCSLKTFAKFKIEYPNLWEELRLLSYDKEMVSPKFKYGLTFQEVDKKIDEINKQITMFDLLEGE